MIVLVTIAPQLFWHCRVVTSPAMIAISACGAYQAEDGTADKPAAAKNRLDAPPGAAAPLEPDLAAEAVLASARIVGERAGEVLDEAGVRRRADHDELVVRWFDALREVGWFVSDAHNFGNGTAGFPRDDGPFSSCEELMRTAGQILWHTSNAFDASYGAGYVTVSYFPAWYAGGCGRIENDPDWMRTGVHQAMAAFGIEPPRVREYEERRAEAVAWANDLDRRVSRMLALQAEAAAAADRLDSLANVRAVLEVSRDGIGAVAALQVEVQEALTHLDQAPTGQPDPMQAEIGRLVAAYRLAWERASVELADWLVTMRQDYAELEADLVVAP